MRYVIFSLALALSLFPGAVPVVQAQQVALSPGAAVESSVSAPDPVAAVTTARAAGPGIQRMPEHLDEVKVESQAGSVSAMRQPSARNIFAIVGVVVVVIALVALLK